jgi:hypothetical protein
MLMNSKLAMPHSRCTRATASSSTPTVSSQYSSLITQEPVIMCMPKRVAPARCAAL